MYKIHHLVLFYISTTYNQNIAKGIQVTERTRSFMPMPMLIPKGSFPKTVCPSTIRAVIVSTIMYLLMGTQNDQYATEGLGPVVQN